eukprot:NODE_771_length_4382_cov_0.329442.p2 type:complete len:215 gc:universal NODE_771_length_4382_cov_0.329442:1376-732(-)
MVIALSFAALSGFCWVSYFLGLNLLIQHGKALDISNVSVLHISKRHFTHFYMFAVFWCLYNFDYSLPMYLFLSHLTRRLVESYLSTYSSYMFIGHYFIGFLHYSLAVLAIKSPSNWNFSFALYLCVAFQILQTFCHIQLIRAKYLRKSHTNLKNLFSILICPHYTFEIYIYISLALYHGNLHTLTMAFWVFSNLFASMLVLKPHKKYYLVPFIY